MAMFRSPVEFTRPVQRILTMLLFLGLVGAVGFYLGPAIMVVFMANPQLNGLICFVFLVGVFVSFWQVGRLFSAVNWLEALAARARGIEAIPPPGLLVAMDPLRKGGAAQGLGATTARSILDSVAARIDESRDTLRYIGGLLIFLGLLGTFWGLAQSVPAVVDTIRAIGPEVGEGGVAVFEKLMGGLEEQLGGMGVAFASSLLGLAGSLVVGFLELMAAGAQGRFYGELETWLSAQTRITSVSEGGGDGATVGGEVADSLTFAAEQMAAINRALLDSESHRTRDAAEFSTAVRSIEQLANQAAADRDVLAQAVGNQERIATALEQLAASGGGSGGGAVGGSGLDAETRRHIRNIDVLLARLIEEAAAGRHETAEALRREMRAVGKAVGKVSAAMSGDG